MNFKQLNQLFMKIDADSGGSVDWNEFMNYMLMETKKIEDLGRKWMELRLNDFPSMNLCKVMPGAKQKEGGGVKWVKNL